LMSLGREASASIRTAVSTLLSADTPDRGRLEPHLVPMAECEMLVPATIGDYTDFYASIHHATNVGSMFRPDNPLLPNYKWIPIGYHGRASSIVASGTPVKRPLGQTREGESDPVFGPSRRLDYEMEVGAFIGRGNQLGSRIALDAAQQHLFGYVLVNDWSARDIQTWEYQPLGPFLAKSFATTVSPWVITSEAVAPYRSAAFTRRREDPPTLPYLDSADDRNHGGLAIEVEVWLSSAAMRNGGIAPIKLSRAEFKSMYWTFGQMVAHHSSNGCNLRPGDLLASGTISGEERDSRGSLLELAWRGTEPLTLPTGESRRFIEDGDEVIMRGYCQRDGFARIGFGECRGVVIPADVMS
jgi:fumarylacetoacetase